MEKLKFGRHELIIDAAAVKLKWEDISTEWRRSYTFPGGDVITIENPIALAVSKTGHRIFAKKCLLDNVCSPVSYYIPSGWISIEWEVYADQPNFVK